MHTQHRIEHNKLHSFRILWDCVRYKIIFKLFLYVLAIRIVWPFKEKNLILKKDTCNVLIGYWQKYIKQSNYLHDVHIKRAKVLSVKAEKEFGLLDFLYQACYSNLLILIWNYSKDHCTNAWGFVIMLQKFYCQNWTAV